jgi:putative toxin-antitoxin system antitoxin component (TIGR02293 family)
MALTAVAAILGGERVLGRKVRSELELEKCARRGFPVGVIGALLARSILHPDELHDMVIPRRTLSHRNRKHERLSRDESNRVSRVARIFAAAVDTLGDEEKARRWLRKPMQRFDGRNPLEMLETDLGASQVEALLGRISHGLAV